MTHRHTITFRWGPMLRRLRRARRASSGQPNEIRAIVAEMRGGGLCVGCVKGLVPKRLWWWA